MQKVKKVEIEDLARLLASTTKGVRPARTRLRLIEPPKPSRFDSITRECCLRRIRFLARAFSLQWLLDQETFNTPGIESVDDDKLAATLQIMERARQYIADGIPLEDTGIICDTSQHLTSLGGP